MTSMVLLGVTAVSATLFGWIAHRLRLPGGLLVGAMIGSAATSLILGAEVIVPAPVATVAFAFVGLTTGLLITPERLRRLRPLAVPAVASAAVLILLGVAVSLALRSLGLAPAVAALASSPGALSVLASVAVAHDEGVAEIMLFHVIRVVALALVVPLILLARPRHAT